MGASGPQCNSVIAVMIYVESQCPAPIECNDAMVHAQPLCPAMPPPRRHERSRSDDRKGDQKASKSGSDGSVTAKVAGSSEPVQRHRCGSYEKYKLTQDRMSCRRGYCHECQVDDESNIGAALRGGTCPECGGTCPECGGATEIPTCLGTET